MGKGSKEVTVGYRYYMGLHFGICHGPVDALLKIEVGGREAWTGEQTVSAQLQLNKPSLFGGDKREGGIKGKLDVMMGETTQVANDYLTTEQGSPQPGYRGFLGAVYRRGQVSAMNPYIKPWAWKVRRILKGWENDGTAWYSAKAAITLANGDKGANPAHIIYECLTNSLWGMGQSPGLIDEDEFEAAADQFYAEGFGLCLAWRNQEKVEDFMQLVCDHVGANVGQDRRTGKYLMRAIREVDDPSTLTLLDETNVVSLESFQRAAQDETINEVTVQYVDVATGKNASVTVQNIASIQAQGAVVSQTKSYPGIPNHDIAVRVAERDLQVASTPVARFKLKTNRAAYNVLPGDAIRFSWPKLGIDEVVLRVLRLDYGDLSNGIISLEAVEDIFSLPDASYLGEQEGLWTPPSTTAVAVTNYEAFEASYMDMVMVMGQTDAETLDTLAGFVGGVAARPTGLNLGWDLYSRTGTDDYVKNGTGDWVPTGTLSADLSITGTSATLSGGSGLEDVTVDTAIMIGTEICRLDTIDPDTGAITFARGCADTVAAAHASGTRVWFYDPWAGEDTREYASGETVDVKFITVTTTEELAVGSAPSDSVSVVGRQGRPYPPGKLRINSLAYPSSVTGTAHTVSWQHRDRLLQADQLVPEGDSSIGPEAGVTCNLSVYNNTTSALLQSYTGLSGTSQAVSFSETVVLLHMDGSDASTTFTDEAGHVWTANGNAQIDTAQSQFGGASGLFDGSGDSIDAPASDVFVLGTGDFTIEFFARPANTSAGQRALCSDFLYSSAGGWAFLQSGTGLEFRIAGLSVVNASGAGLVAATQQHVALTRQGTTFRVFRAGVLIASGTSSTNLTNNRIQIGRLSSGSYYNGHIDEFRLTKGTALYTATFTPPASAFTIAAPPASVRVELESVRAGLTSYQKHSHVMSVTP